MKFKLSAVVLLFALLAAARGAAPVLAQGPLPPPPVPIPPPATVPAWDPALGPRHPLGPVASADAAVAQTIALGQPGLSFRYVSTFGQTGVAYLDDSAHLNYPWGLGLDNGSIWIAELWGNRAMKYDSAGVFQQQIGIAGEGNLTNTIALWEIADVAADTSGNIWVVDDGASHVVKFGSSGLFIRELGTSWSSGTGNYRFNTPVSIAFDAAGNIYVSDGAPWWSVNTGNHRIQVFNSAGKYLATIGKTGESGSANDRFHGPSHITTFGNGAESRLYVADAGNQRVQIFDISSPDEPTHVATLGTTGVRGTDHHHFDHPTGVAVGNDHIYVADTLNHRIQVFNRSSPYDWVATLGVTGAAGVDNSHFNNPTDVSVDGGNVYVADFANTRVQRFTQTGTSFVYALTYGASGVPYVTDGFHYNDPSSVAVSEDGSIVLVEESGQRLVKLTAAGTKIWSVGMEGVKGDWDYGSNRFNNPADLALDASGRVFVADRWHYRVQVYNSNGTYSTSITNLNCPGGVHVAPNGYLYVANTCDHTVKIYNSSLSLVATLGVSGVPGTDNAHFNSPEDVAVDSNGVIYVSDQKNNRIQVYGSNRVYVGTIGISGSCGADFAQLCVPDGLFVDDANRLYVADPGNNRIQVFDPNHAYLTTVGGSWGTGADEMRSPVGIAVDSKGAVYVADRNNDRIQKFARRIPGWDQMNINGFGDRWNGQVSALASFSVDGRLYAGTTNSVGAELWRSNDGLNWSPAMSGGFGDARNVGFDNLIEFAGRLYAGLWSCANANCTTSTGGQIWRSANGIDWEQVVNQGFDGPENGEVYALGALNDMIYASTWTWDTSDTGHGGEIWSSSTGNPYSPLDPPELRAWKKVVPDGFVDRNNWATMSFETFNGSLYAGTYNSATGAEIWRCSICSGASTDWAQANVDGFGDGANVGISDMAAFGGYLYASTMHASGGSAELWRCQLCNGSDWLDVGGGLPWGAATNGDGGLQPFGSELFFAADNRTTGTQVWKCTSCDGTDWVQVGAAGFGDSNNGVHADKLTTFDNRLYIGTYNYANGGELWSPPALPYPVVASIKLANPSPTNAAKLSYIVTFSNNVTGVDKGDFQLAMSAHLSGASITACNGSGDTYLVTVSRGTGNGTLRLDLADDDSIVDEATGTQHLGGLGPGNGDFTAGESYVIPVSMTVRSNAAQDGWVLESGENTGVGGSLDAVGKTFSLGDDEMNRQYRAVLSFNTATLDDGAVVTGITLKIKRSGLVGSLPFGPLGNIQVDAKRGTLGTAALQLTDFQAAVGASGRTAALTMKNDPLAGSWYYATLGSTANPLINKAGNTQMRLRFAKDDNNDGLANLLSFYSGNTLTASYRPLLIIQYYVP